MKKSTWLTAAFTLLAALPFSCTQEESAAPDASDAAAISRTFTCTFADAADSRLSIDGSGKTTWEVGDEIMIHGGEKGAGRCKVTLQAGDISADGKKATITVEGLEPYDRSAEGILSGYYAQYPASAVPEGKMYSDCCFTETNAPLMAACDVGDSFVFYNLCGVISFKVSGEMDRVVFSGNGAEPLSYDYYQARVRDDGKGAEVTYFKPGNGFPTYTPVTQITAPVVSDGVTENRLFLPAGANFTQGFTFKFYKGNEAVAVAQSNRAVQVGPGQMLQLGDVSTHFVPDADAQRLARLGQRPVVMVYFTEYTPSSEFPTLEDVRCFTHINAGHARFVNPKTGDGGLVVKSPGYSYMQRLAAYKADYPELKLLLFIGGWGKNADGFSEMAKDPDKRALFCSECVRLCDELNFDGVDIDWEYPTYSADKGKDGYEGTGADPADTENFVILARELREALGPNRLISYAASDSGKYIDNYAMLEYVDYINVMTYSMGNPPYHNSPLYRSSLTKSRSCEESIAIFHNQGVPYDRMCFGLAYYGHADGTVYPSSMPYHKVVDALTTGYVDGKSVAGYNYRCWDDVGKNVYLGDASGTMYSSYEDVESLSYRVAFAKEKGMLGVFGWEYREDAKDGTLRKAVRQMMNGETPEQPVDPEDPGDGPDPSNCENLSVDGSANCYLITAAGSYKFPTVRGNTSTSVGSVARVELLWETEVGMIPKLGCSAGWVTFSTPSALEPGNALIAAKDSSGKILWSWHIWIPKTAPTASTYGDLATSPLMSRNLGALVDAGSTANAESYGLYYQWGRSEGFTTQGSALSTEQSYTSPTVLVTISGDWNSSTDGLLWGDSNSSKPSVKTENDPCPPGYRVPNRCESVLFTGTESSIPGWSFSKSGRYYTAGSPAHYFPLAGYISEKGSYKDEGTAYLWNAHHDGDVPGKAYCQSVSSSGASKKTQIYKCTAASVRCIAE